MKSPSKDDVLFHSFAGGMSSLYTKLRDQRDRLFVLATKHCPKDHHDWQEILEFEKEINKRPEDL